MRKLFAFLLTLMIPATAMATPAEEHLESMLKTGIPEHAHSFQVINFLNANHIAYTGGGSGIEGIIEHSPKNYLVIGTVHIHFTFDANDQLVSYTVKEKLPPKDGNGGNDGQAH